MAMSYVQSLENRKKYGNYGWWPGKVSPADKLKAEYQTAYDEAKAVNLKRYEEILGGYDTRYTEAISGLEGLGDIAKKDVRTSYARSTAAGAQNLISSGLHSTTIAPAMYQQSARQETDALARVNEALRRERLGYQTSLSGQRLDFMERREDEYPSENLYVQLMNQLGQGRGQN